MLQIFDKRHGKLSDGRNEPASPQWLDHLLQVITLLQDAGDLAPVPYVSVGLSVVINILKIIKTAKQNQDDFRQLVTNIVGIVTLVRDEIVNRKLQTESTTFLAYCETFNESLLDIMTELNNKLRSLSGPRKYLLASSIKEDIQKHQDRIHECRANFLLWIVMQNRLTVHQVHNSIHEMRNDISQLSPVMALVDEDGTSGTGHATVAPSMSSLSNQGEGLLVIEDDIEHLQAFHVDLLPRQLSPPRGTFASGTCFRCERLKVRCEFRTDTGPCQRCVNGGHECFIPTPKKRRDSLNHKHSVEEGDEHIQQLTSPSETFTKENPEGSHLGSTPLLVESEQEELVDVRFRVPDLPVEGSKARVQYVGSTRRSRVPSTELVDWDAIGVTNIQAHSENSGSTADFASCLDSGEFCLSEWYNFDSSSSRDSHRFSSYSDRYGSSAGSSVPRSRVSRSPSVFSQTSSAVSYRRPYSIYAPRYSPYSRSVSPLVPVSSHPSLIQNPTSWSMQISVGASIENVPISPPLELEFTLRFGV
ncbi:hypothetical protein C8J56DRAFT_483094 [Mycena floridula]|nr:hypothetical protein C8J56DRAFT_483094 [Mycena floridula]